MIGLKIKKDQPVVELAILFSLPLVLAISAISRPVALAVAITVIVVSFLLTLGTPPVYLALIMLLTMINPVGLFLPSLIVKEGQIDFR